MIKWLCDHFAKQIYFFKGNFIDEYFSYLLARYQNVLVLILNLLLQTSSEITFWAHQQEIENFKQGLQFVPIWECNWSNVWIFRSLHRQVGNQCNIFYKNWKKKSSILEIFLNKDVPVSWVYLSSCEGLISWFLGPSWLCCLAARFYALFETILKKKYYGHLEAYPVQIDSVA